MHAAIGSDAKERGIERPVDLHPAHVQRQHPREPVVRSRPRRQDLKRRRALEHHPTLPRVFRRAGAFPHSPVRQFPTAPVPRGMTDDSLSLLGIEAVDIARSGDPPVLPAQPHARTAVTPAHRAARRLRRVRSHCQGDARSSKPGKARSKRGFAWRGPGGVGAITHAPTPPARAQDEQTTLRHCGGVALPDARLPPPSIVPATASMPWLSFPLVVLPLSELPAAPPGESSKSRCRCPGLRSRCCRRAGCRCSRRRRCRRLRPGRPGSRWPRCQ